MNIAEIGVFKGYNAYRLALWYPNATLLLCDNYRQVVDENDPMWHSHFRSNSQADLDQIRDDAIALMSEFGGRVTWYHTPSHITARSVPPQSMDLVFIDGNHGLEDVRRDIAAWHPKVRSGGILAGHDYSAHNDRRGKWGVRQAVEEWSERTGIEHEVEQAKVWFARIP